MTRPTDRAEVEQALLGGLLLDSSKFGEVASIVTPRSFGDPGHAMIFGTIGALVAEDAVVDAVVVADRLNGQAEQVGGLAYLNGLALCVPSAANVLTHARRVADAAALRELALVGAELQREATAGGDPAGLVQAMHERLDSVPVGPAQAPDLAQFIDLDLQTVRAPEFVIDDVMVAGVCVLAGGEGQGKTVQLVSLLVKAAWLCKANDPLRPLLRRRVIYIAEDVPQVRRILASILRFGGTGCAEADFDEWFKVVPATRGPAGRFVAVLPEYLALRAPNLMANGGARMVDPVIVLDTRSAVMATDDENSNAQTSNDIALLKQQFGLPVVIVGHLAKALNKSDVSAMSLRGAGAAQGDAHQTMFLYHDKDVDKRYLHVGPPAKRRFESQVEALEFVGVSNQIEAVDPLGNTVPVWVRHSTIRQIGGEELRQTRAAAMEDRKAEENAQASRELRGRILDEVEQAAQRGAPLTRTQLRDLIGVQTAKTVAAVAALEAELLLVDYVLPVPNGMRLVNSKRRSFLVRLNRQQGETYRTTGTLPAELVRAPAGWLIPAKPSKGAPT